MQHDDSDHAGLRYRLLGPSGLRVSELCLGTMTFGEGWGFGADAATSRRLFDTFAAAGGNFIDTANSYTGGESERLVGDCVRADRDRFVLATKYTHAERPGDPNAGGNHRKSLRQAVHASLARLGTDHLDLLWLHAWDGLVTIDEVLRALDDLVRAGDVLHVGLSDTPAWVASQGQAIASLRGWTPLTAIQAEYSLVARDAERELLPMAAALGLAVTAWAPLGAGLLTGKYEVPLDAAQPARLRDVGMYHGARDGRTSAIAQAVRDVAATRGITPAQVALAWLLDRAQPVIPVVGARTPAQLAENLRAVTVRLDDDARATLEAAAPASLGFPHDFLRSDVVRAMTFGGTWERLALAGGTR